MEFFIQNLEINSRINSKSIFITIDCIQSTEMGNKNIGCKMKFHHSSTWSLNITYLKETNHMNHNDSSSNNKYYLLCITMLNVPQTHILNE